MDSKSTVTKHCLLEGGLPCASLSAECQRDNNARQRPPQNRLHIWWGRRPPTISRAAVLSALLPYDLSLDESVLPPMVPELSEEDLENLPPKLQSHREFFSRLLEEVNPTPLTKVQDMFLRALGITGDPDRAYRRMGLRKEYHIGSSPILLPMDWTYRHKPAFQVSPSSELMDHLLAQMQDFLGLDRNEQVILLDFMAGGGCIPIEGTRYGMKVFANELNPVATLVLNATIEYPSHFGRALVPKLLRYVIQISDSVRLRLRPFFYVEPPEIWWSEESERVAQKYKNKSIIKHEAEAVDSSKNCSLWCHVVPCPKGDLNIPISTNFSVVNKKGKPEAALAAFPEVPERWQGNDCTFRIVKRAEWAACK